MSLKEKLLNYKHKVAGKYIPVRSDQITKRVFEMEKYFISTKIDGNISVSYTHLTLPTKVEV